jgi:hypothetical protein
MTQPKQNKKKKAQTDSPSELLDRLSIACAIVDQYCVSHPSADSDKKTKALLDSALSKIYEAYQRTGKLLVKEDKGLTDFQKKTRKISSQLSQIKYKHGDISDLGNEVGIAIGEHLKTEKQLRHFIAGLEHGISIKNNTHG